MDGTCKGFSLDVFLRFCLRGMQSYLERYEKREKTLDDLIVSLDQIPDTTYQKVGCR